MLNEKIATEQQEQQSFVKYLKLNGIPHFHTPNGGFRNAREAVRLKAMGVVAGIPDIFVHVPSNGFCGLFIELKRRKGGSLSIQQKEKIDELNALGYLAVVCKGWEDCVSVTNRYLNGIW